MAYILDNLSLAQATELRARVAGKIDRIYSVRVRRNLWRYRRDAFERLIAIRELIDSHIRRIRNADVPREYGWNGYFNQHPAR